MWAPGRAGVGVRFTGEVSPRALLPARRDRGEVLPGRGAGIPGRADHGPGPKAAK